MKTSTIVMSYLGSIVFALSAFASGENLTSNKDNSLPPCIVNLLNIDNDISIQVKKLEYVAHEILKLLDYRYKGSITELYREIDVNAHLLNQINPLSEEMKTNRYKLAGEAGWKKVIDLLDSVGLNHSNFVTTNEVPVEQLVGHERHKQNLINGLSNILNFMQQNRYGSLLAVLKQIHSYLEKRTKNPEQLVKALDSGYDILPFTTFKGYIFPKSISNLTGYSFIAELRSIDEATGKMKIIEGIALNVTINGLSYFDSESQTFRFVDIGILSWGTLLVKFSNPPDFRRILNNYLISPQYIQDRDQAEKVLGLNPKDFKNMSPLQINDNLSKRKSHLMYDYDVEKEIPKDLAAACDHWSGLEFALSTFKPE